MSAPVLVTGASGGLGLSLVAELTAAGRTVIALGRRPAEDARLLAQGVTYHRADISDRTIAHIVTAPGVRTVFHCAALSSPWGREQDFVHANVDATRNMLDAAAQNGVRTFVHVSTPSIYASMRDRIGITERDGPADPPLCHYARTKLEAERLVLDADGDMRTVAVRPRGIVGPDDAVVMPRLAAIARRRRIPLVRGGRALVEMIDVRDVVGALLAAEGRIDDAHGMAINVSGGRPITIRAAAQALAQALGSDPTFIEVPLAVAKAVASCVDRFWPEGGGLGEPSITRYALATLGWSQTFDLERARRVLEWSPRHDAFATLLEQARRIA